MFVPQTRIIVPGVLFGFVLLSGLWMSNSAKPLNLLLFNIHKFAALGALVYLGVTVYQINQAAHLTIPEVIAAVVTVLLFVGTIIMGGLLSLDKPMPRAILILHQITPFLTILAYAVAFYLLLNRNQ